MPAERVRELEWVDGNGDRVRVRVEIHEARLERLYRSLATRARNSKNGVAASVGSGAIRVVLLHDDAMERKRARRDGKT